MAKESTKDHEPETQGSEPAEPDPVMPTEVESLSNEALADQVEGSGEAGKEAAKRLRSMLV